MSYEIVIKKKHVETRVTRGDWVKISDEEVERDETFYARNSDEPKTRIKDVMGYAPNTERIVEVETEILKQTIEDLDLAAVIKAINKI